VNVRYDLRRESGRELVLAIGFFDGMHLGHREIARAALRMRHPGRRAGVLTFSNHPASFLRPGTEPPLLTTSQERLDLFAQVGFEECFFVPFDDSIASMTPPAFLEMLKTKLGVRGLAVGETFRFGHKRAGDVSFMKEYLASSGVEISAVPTAAVNGERISSSRIRALISDGEIERADALLGAAYEIRGTVEIGAGRGHALGFPTANVRPPWKLLPPDGIYSGLARYDGRDYPSLISIGKNPQFSGEQRTIEAWLRDFRKTIYGRELALRDLRFVREQRLFASVDELIEQMRLDSQAIAYPSFL
jgi:riboflavin kinase / FMN adenylyltransferase